MQDLFSSAASLLLGDAVAPNVINDAARLLTELGYAGAAGTEPDGERRHRARLLLAASQFIRIFELAPPDAPRLIAFGAELDPASADAMHAGSPPVGVSGVGVTLQDAFQGCVGEGVEYLSQLQRAGDVLIRGDGTAQVAALDAPARELVGALLSRCDGRLPSWRRAVRLSDQAEIWLPADLCLRRPPAAQDFAPPFPLSIGSAAGTSWEGAALHGLLELIERDAASLWWRGGRRGQAVPPYVEAATLAMLLELRAGAPSPRRSWLLDITTDLGIPAVASLSCRADGSGFAFGLAARRTLDQAARSAALEMCQGELACAVVEAKRRERGEAALNARDRGHLQRATVIDANRCELLHPAAGSAHHVAIEGGDAPAALRAIVRRLAAAGIETYGLDLTCKELGIPVARIIAPALQAEPSSIITSRLSAMIARTGGGDAFTGGIQLI